ncbi:hypothetical protein BGZ93_004125, partial [Podila epicladia]
MKGGHTGKNYAEALVNVLERFHIGEKLQSVTTDNASNMGKMPPKDDNLYPQDDDDDEIEKVTVADRNPSQTPAERQTTLKRLRKGIVKI